MATIDTLCGGLAPLLKAAAARVPVNALAVILEDGPEHGILVCANALGLAAYRGSRAAFPPGARPGLPAPPRAVLDLAANPDGFVERRLLLTGFADGFRKDYGVRRALTLSVPDSAPSAVLLVGFGEAEPSQADREAAIESLAPKVAGLLGQVESSAARLERLRRLELVDALLPTLFRVLDVREIFDRLSTISREGLPHDVMVLGLFSADVRQIEVYAQTASSRLPEISSHPWPPSQYEGWLCRVIDDVRDHPIERDSPWRKTGIRSSIRLAIRLADDVLGVLNFSSTEVARYTGVDLAIGRHVADYVALAMSHQRLAETARRSEELRLRAAQSDLLDELLVAVTGAGELPDVFPRVSSLATKVLAHDALLLSVLLPKGREARLYASQNSSAPPFPETLGVPRRASRHEVWEFELIDDLTADDEPRNREAAQRGNRSALRVPIRLEGELAADLAFLSSARGQYRSTDVPAARRIADRLSVGVARERSRIQERRADEAAARTAELEARVRTLTEELNARSGFHRVIGDSAPWRRVLTQATQVGPTETTVLLLGESGTGKEVVARFLHRASSRAPGPFVAVNCAALPEQLLEAELFGYERGAFTGATQSKPGQLEHAAGGTLFLDEVAEMSLSAQAKFLRVLQEREFKRLGATRVLKADVRVVAATNRDLERAMAREQFREDLYYRLNVFSISLPPLRERRDDIAGLSQSFLGDLAKTLGRPPAGISQDAQLALLQYDWPGNVRELRNMLERAAILADGGLIVSEHLAFRPGRGKAPEPAAAASRSAVESIDKGSTLNAVERAMLEKALADARFNKSRAAKILGITRGQLYAKLRRHGLD
jgi:two-component system response regulator FlrC